MPGLLNAHDALLAMIDLQENHYPSVVDGEATLDRLARFVTAARLLDVPVVWTEHYPKAFGPTLDALARPLKGLAPLAKTSFGCFGDPAFAEQVEEWGRRTLVLVGTETHICVQQTALMALDRGMGAVVVTDCVTARNERDHEVALGRMERAGAVLTTWEALVYEWMRGAGHPVFKRVLPLVKGD